MHTPLMTAQELRRRHIRRAQYVACDDAFIDVRLPGSSPKLNYSIIGPGVTQNAGQVVNLREPHGFNIGAAGLAPGITNNLHLHFTAEVFIACEGRFRLRWGARGDEGEALLEEGDVICMPTWMFRGFSCEGPHPGFLMTVLGGDDTGGIIWSPDVMQRARATGLYLGRDNQIIDVAPGHAPPSAAQLLPLMPPDEVDALRRWTPEQLLARCVRRAQRDFRAATLDSVLPGCGWQVAPVAGWGISQHRDHRAAVTDAQGFSIDWLRLLPGQSSEPLALAEPAVLVHAQGPLVVEFPGAGIPQQAALGAWDTLSLPAGIVFRLRHAGGVDGSVSAEGAGPAEALLVVHGDAPKRLQYAPDVAARAARHDMTLDASGHLARLSLLPPAMNA